MSKATFLFLALYISGCQDNELVAVGFLAAGALWLIARSSAVRVAPMIRARRFELVDGRGRPRLEQGVSADGLVYLCLRDPDGSERAAMKLADDGTTALTLHHAKGNGKIAFGVNADGTSNAFVTDAEGVVRYAARTDLGGAPLLALFDAAGVERAVLKLQSDGTASLTLRDASGQVRVGQTEGPDDGGTVMVCGVGGRGAGSLSSGPDGASLKLTDEERVLRASLSARQSGPSLSIYDQSPRIRLGVTSEGVAQLLLFDNDVKSRVGIEMTSDGVAAIDVTNGETKILSLP